MHKQLRELLNDAEGVSEFIIAVNVDIRGFSEFSRRVESPDAAMYVKRVYIRLIDECFTDASFFKPTGDGLLLTFPYKENNLEEVFGATMQKCWKAIKIFPRICERDPMINFSVPKNIGIGIARGTACRITSNNATVDYSGHVLNLASRLMDIARPCGIVFADQFGETLLGEKKIKKFNESEVYLKGIAEDRPIQIFYSRGLTKISPIHKSPLNKVSWKTIHEVKTRFEMEQLTEEFYYDLEAQPTDTDKILVEAAYPIVKGGTTIKDAVAIFSPDFTYEAKGDEHKVLVGIGNIIKQAIKNGVKEDGKIEIKIKYPVRDEAD